MSMNRWSVMHTFFPNVIIGRIKLFIRLILIVGVSFVLLAYYKKCSPKDLDIEIKESRFRMKGPLRPDDKNIIKILKDEFLDPPSSLPYNISAANKYGSGALYGLNNNLNVLKELFKNKPPGFFVEAGALDGVFLSNTLWLERAMNWTGILIEPNPHSYKELLFKHRKAWTSNTCIAAEGYPKESVFVLPVVANRYFQSNVIGSSYEYGILYKDKGMNNFVKSFTETYQNVACFPLYSYFLALNVAVVDFLSLDIQGTEIDVLETLPLDKITVNVLLIEDMNKPESSDHQIFIKRIKEKNFTMMFHLGYDVFFVNQNYVL